MSLPTGEITPAPVTNTRVSFSDIGTSYEWIDGELLERRLARPVPGGHLVRWALVRPTARAAASTSRLPGGLSLEVVQRVAHGSELVRVLVGNIDAEFLFQRHDEFNNVQRVRSEVLDELGLGRQLLGVHLELLGDDLFHPVFAEGCHVIHLLWIGTSFRLTT